MGNSPWGHKESDVTEQLTLDIQSQEGYFCDAVLAPGLPAGSSRGARPAYTTALLRFFPLPSSLLLGALPQKLFHMNPCLRLCF